MLKRQGHRVLAVGNGLEAINALKSGDLDCILMDIQMPEMDGVQATRIIRGSSEFGAKAKIPIIAITAYAMQGDREKFLRAGMDGYITKPVQLSELVSVLDQVVGARGQAKVSSPAV